MEKNKGLDIVLFNLDLNKRGEFKKQQKKVAINLMRKCKIFCLKDVLFVLIKNKNDFLADPENKQKTFLFFKERRLVTPLKVVGKKKDYKNCLDMINTEALEYVIENNNENHFKIYENHLKGMLIMVINTEDESIINPILEDFKKVAKIHKHQRTEYLDRFAFILVDLKKGEDHANKMFYEVSGDIEKDIEFFLLCHGTQEDPLQNYRLDPNFDDVQSFYKNLRKKIAKYDELNLKVKKNKEDIVNTNQELTDDEQRLLVEGDVYGKEWEALIDYNVENNVAESKYNFNTMMSFIFMKDIDELIHKHFRSEEEDKDHNEKNLDKGILHITRNNYDRLVHDVDSPDERDYDEATKNFLLIICKRDHVEDEENCQQGIELLKFIEDVSKAENFRVGVYNNSQNDHHMIERFMINEFPAYIFYGAKAKVRRGKIYRSLDLKEHFMNWINEKFEENDQPAIELDSKQQEHYLSIVAPDEL